MASLTKRNSTRVIVDVKTGKEKAVTIERYRARYRDEAGVEHARHFTKKADAQGWLDDATAGLVRGDWVDPAAGRITFAQWWGQWAASQWGRRHGSDGRSGARVDRLRAGADPGRH